MSAGAWCAPAVLVIGLALAGCQAEPQQPSPAPEPATAPAALACAPQPAPEPIPAEYHGIWDTEQGDCSATSSTRVTIRIDGVSFHDSRKQGVSATCTDGTPVLSLHRKGSRLVMTHAPDNAKPSDTLTLKPCLS